VQELKLYLQLCKDTYYIGEPLISDAEFDMLEEIHNEDLTVGTNRGKMRHWYRMYSLQKIYRGDPTPTDRIYWVTPKLDGASLSLRYLNGQVSSVVTRGNGEYGEDVTHLFTGENCENLNIPYILKSSSIQGPVQITGEIVAPKTLKNARNYAAGALNLKDPLEFQSRDLTFFAYDMQPSPSSTYLGTLARLKDEGFKTVKSKEADLYPQDGLVFRVDSNIAYQDMGFTSKHPRGAFALKERSEGVLTTVREVKWQTGKSGKVTPVAIVDTVNIEGANVSRVTLNNVGFIKALGLQIGDSVFIERAGGIIPRIIKKAE
jgi:NAD-dependent DNA ligase